MNKIVVSLSSLVIGVVLIFVFVDPLWSSIWTLRERTDSKREEIVRIESLISKKQELEKKYQEAEEEVKKVFLALPKEEDIPYLMSQLDAMASKNGLLTESMIFSHPADERRQSEKNAPGFSNLTTDVKLSGSYEAFKGYLKDIEGSLRMMEAVSMDFALQKGLLGLNLFNFNLKLNVFYQ